MNGNVRVDVGDCVADCVGSVARRAGGCVGSVARRAGDCGGDIHAKLHRDAEQRRGRMRQFQLWHMERFSHVPDIGIDKLRPGGDDDCAWPRPREQITILWKPGSANQPKAEDKDSSEETAPT